MTHASHCMHLSAVHNCERAYKERHAGHAASPSGDLKHVMLFRVGATQGSLPPFTRVCMNGMD
eukprot:scaffold42674_cov17-Tisochrysis_lutea.AAC.1